MRFRRVLAGQFSLPAAFHLSPQGGRCRMAFHKSLMTINTETEQNPRT